MLERSARSVSLCEPAVPAQCQSCPIRHSGLCHVLPDQEIAKFEQIARRHSVPAGEILLLEGEPPEFFANIVSGVVKLTKTLSDGDEQIVGLLFTSDFVGRVLGEENPFSAEAVTDVELCSYPFAAFRRMMHDHPDVEQWLFEKTLDELDAARDWMVLLGRKSAAAKVASLLELIARREAGEGPPVFTLPLRRVDMADYLGLTVETISRHIAKLKADRIIAVSGRGRDIVVRDMAALGRIARCSS